MTLSIALLFCLIAGMIVLFAFEIFPADKVAFVVLGVLIITGLVSPEEAISGFSNPATIAILALMIIAIGLEDNGVINLMSDVLSRVQVLPLLLVIPIFMMLSGVVSAFISTTAVVIVLIKVLTAMSANGKISRAKLLMPISFAGIVGGSCTLMGTSTNLLVNSIARNSGAEPLDFFALTPYGVIFMLITILTMLLLARWLPKEGKQKLIDKYEVADYVATLVVEEDSDWIGKSFQQNLGSDLSGLELRLLKRNSSFISDFSDDMVLQAGDSLLVSGEIKKVMSLEQVKGIRLKGRNSSETKNDKQDDVETRLLEVLVLPQSRLVGKKMSAISPYELGGAIPLAMSKDGNTRTVGSQLVKRLPKRLRIEEGDRLLLEVNDQQLQRINRMSNIIALNEHDLPTYPSKWKRVFSILILLLVIGFAASGLFSILKSTLIGVVLMLVFKCIDLQAVYSRVNWQVIFLLAGMIPLGIALHNTGADQWLSDHLLQLLKGHPPILILGTLFFLTMLLSGFVSNNATAIIVTPVALSIAIGLSLPQEPFILAVMFASNFSFFTPVGYQTNMLIFGTGLYRFRDFALIGGVLSIVLWIVATFLLSWWGGLL